MVRWCWVNFQRRGVLLIWMIVRQGPTALAVGAGGSCLDIFSLVYHFSFLSPSLWETARYRLKYCLKGPLSPQQPTNQIYQDSLHPHPQIPWTNKFIITNKVQAYELAKFCQYLAISKRDFVLDIIAYHYANVQVNEYTLQYSLLASCPQ